MGKNTILIIDDNAKNIQVLANILLQSDYDVEYCLDGPTAIELVRNENIDLILLDIMMPIMDGYSVCKQIKELPGKKSIPILFLTAKTDMDSLSKAFSVGGVDYITKPFYEVELLSRINTHLELKKHKENLEELVKDQTQELRKANKALKSLDNLKAEFLKIISHEIRTSLNGIKGFVDILKENIGNNELLQYLEYIQNSSFRLEKFALQALLVTELKSKKKELSYTKIALKTAIQQLISVKFHQTVKEKSINTLFKIEPDDISVYADKELFIKAISGIIENATINCEVKGNIEFKANIQDSSLMIEISDNGPGFSDKALEYVFNLFMPGETYINENMGLDLAIAKLIMQAHNGSIHAHNSKKGGAVVKLLFPIK